MIWNFTSSTALSELSFAGGGRIRPLVVVRSPRARGYRLTVDPRDAIVRVTIPRRAPVKEVARWVSEKREWVEAELSRLPPPVPIVPGMIFRLAGKQVSLDWRPDRPRRVQLVDCVLSVGGPRDQLPARLLRHLRAEALRVLDEETRELAARNDIAISRVGVGDPKARWGSCSSLGDIRYSWRLILAPEFVRRATVAHEVAHRIHMDHSPAFHRLASELGGVSTKDSRGWLRVNGAALHWFGRDG